MKFLLLIHFDDVQIFRLSMNVSRWPPSPLQPSLSNWFDLFCFFCKRGSWSSFASFVLSSSWLFSFLFFKMLVIIPNSLPVPYKTTDHTNVFKNYELSIDSNVSVRHDWWLWISRATLHALLRFFISVVVITRCRQIFKIVEAINLFTMYTGTMSLMFMNELSESISYLFVFWTHTEVSFTWLQF